MTSVSDKVGLWLDRTMPNNS